MRNFAVRTTEGVFYLSGELDMAEVDTFLGQFTDAPGGDGPVVIDLEGLTFMDSSGVHAIMRIAKMCAGRGVVLRMPRAEVARVLEIVGMAEVPGIEIQKDAQPHDGPGAWSAFEAIRSSTQWLVQESSEAVGRARATVTTARELRRRSVEERAKRHRVARSEPV